MKLARLSGGALTVAMLTAWLSGCGPKAIQEPDAVAFPPPDAPIAAEEAAGAGDIGDIAVPGDMDLSDLDIEVYPEAEPIASTDIDGKYSRVVSLTLTTDDGFDKVERFYAERYPKAQARAIDGGGSLQRTLEISGDPDARTVRIMRRDDDGKVEIQLMHNTLSDEAQR